MVFSSRMIRTVASIFDSAGLPTRAAAVAWSAAFGNDLSAAWDACSRADWLLWMAYANGRTSADFAPRARAMVRAVCACAQQLLASVPMSEHRPMAAIALTMRWTTGGARSAALAAASVQARAAANELSIAPPGTTLKAVLAALAAEAIASAAATWADLEETLSTVDTDDSDTSRTRFSALCSLREVFDLIVQAAQEPSSGVSRQPIEAQTHAGLAALMKSELSL
jgi:hypothetical protein